MTDSPIACALEASDFGRRLVAIAELNRSALRSSSCDDLQLELVYAKEALARVRDFVRREEECCAFLVFQIDEEGEAVRVTVRAPEDARVAADALFEQFRAVVAAAPAAAFSGEGESGSPSENATNQRPVGETRSGGCCA